MTDMSIFNLRHGEKTQRQMDKQVFMNIVRCGNEQNPRCVVIPECTADIIDGASQLTAVYNGNVLSSWKHLLPIGGCRGYQLYCNSRLLMVQAILIAAPCKIP